MKDEIIINRLESAWEFDKRKGFFFSLRDGELKLDEAEDLLAFLKEVSFEGKTFINREIVELLWFIPTYLDYNLEKVANDLNYSRFRAVCGDLQGEIMRILGVP